MNKTQQILVNLLRWPISAPELAVWPGFASFAPSESSSVVVDACASGKSTAKPEEHLAGKKAKLVSLTGLDRTTRDTMTAQDRLQRVEPEYAYNAGGKISVEAPACSVGELLVQ